MRTAILILLGLMISLAAFAEPGGDALTCDQCMDVEETLYPTAAWQTATGSTVGTGEYAYYFCAIGGGTYTFTTCDAPGFPGGADYDTALSVWSISGAACGTQEGCNDDSCNGGSSGLLSTIDFVAPANGDYIIVVDAFSSGSGNYTLGYMGPECATPVEPSTWGEVKATFE